MYGYDGASVDIEGERIREHAVHQHSRSSAWSNMRFERALIRSFSEDGNSAEVELDDGSVYFPVRIQTPLSWILFHYGETDKLFDIPGLIIYRAIPYDGFIMIGEMFYQEEDEGSRIINEPFYL